MSQNTDTDYAKWIGELIQVNAYNSSYVGILLDVNFDNGTIKLTNGEDTISLDIARIETLAPVDIVNATY